MQSQNKNDSVQLSTRYQQYDFAKRHLGGFSGRQVFSIGESNEVFNQERMGSPTSISALTSTDYKGASRQRPNLVVPVLTPDRPHKRQNGRRFKEDGDPSFTLTGQDKHGIYDGMKIRRLTPVECERLMGLEDNYTAGVSDSQRYKLCGNGVVVNVVEEIIKRLFDLSTHSLF